MPNEIIADFFIGVAPSDYVSQSQLQEALETKQDVLTAGDNIVIDNNVISADLTDLQEELDENKQAIVDEVIAREEVDNNLQAQINAIPAVNNSTITIKQGGTTKGSFTLNQATDGTIELDTGSGGDAQPKSTADYSLGNSAGGWTVLTSDQQNAINSNATSAKIASYDSHLVDKDNPHEVTKAQVGLGNVDNTSDASKPISAATQTALDSKQDIISDLATIRSNAQDGKSAHTTIQTYGDIVTHNVSEFATAAQGAKADSALQPGDNISELVNDSGYITNTSISHLATKSELTTGLAAKQDTLVSGTNIKTINNIPLVGAGNITVGGTVESVNTKTGAVVLTASDVGALPDTTKYGNFLDASFDDTTSKLTITLKDQDGTTLSNKEVDLSFESVIVGGSYDSVNQKIVFTLSNGTTIDIPVGDLVAGLQTEITASNKLNADLVDDTTSSHKFVTANDKTTWNAKQDAINDLATIRAGATAGSTALQPGDNVSDLVNDAGYITSTDLSNYTTETYVDTELDKKQDKLVSGTTLKTVNNHSLLGSGNIDTEYTAGTGISITSRAISVDSTIAKKSEIPTNNNQLTNGAGYITGITSGDVTTALGFTPANSANLGTMAAENASDYTKTSGLATVATSGSYNDLTNKPTIPAAQVNSDWNATTGVAQILNKPTIPTVNNPTITFTQGGTTKGSFTLNQATGTTIALDASGSTYTAGTGIDITNDVISAKIATAVSSSSTNEQSVGAKLFYDTCGDIEALINAL